MIACSDNSYQAPATFRLPKNRTEGDMPRVALSTGCDPMECLLRKIGIDDAEFTAGDGVGRVQLYRGAGGGGVAGSSSAYEFWSNEAKMSTYDVVINACECMPFTDVAGETDDAVDWTPGGQCNVGPNFIDDTFPKVKRSRSG